MTNDLQSTFKPTRAQPEIFRRGFWISNFVSGGMGWVGRDGVDGVDGVDGALLWWMEFHAPWNHQLHKTKSIPEYSRGSMSIYSLSWQIIYKKLN